MKIRYHSFLLRLWASEANGKTTWRFSVECPETGNKHKFVNLGELMEFFETLIQAPSVSGENTEGEYIQ